MIAAIITWAIVLKLMGVSFYGQLFGLSVQYVGILLMIVLKKRIWS